MKSHSDRVNKISSKSIFTEITLLSKKHNAIDIGHGFPNTPAPSFLKKACIEAVQNDANQYTFPRGRIVLSQLLSEMMKKKCNLFYDPERSIVVTQGATEAVFCTIMGFVNPGDEVIVFDPCYITYIPGILMAGGVPRIYPLLPPNWEIDEQKLRTLFTNKTKLIICNSPHNPTGKVFTKGELALIAKLCCEYDVVALSDEVYHELVFEPYKYTSLCSLPGMYERTITVSTIGKTFEVTGWKVGWAISTPEIIDVLLRVRLNTSTCGTTPVQEASTMALKQSRGYYLDLVERYKKNRDYLVQTLSKAGFIPYPSQGTYFLMASCSPLGFKSDLECVKYLITDVGIGSIPASFLYNATLPQNIQLIRFAFCKDQRTLQEVNDRLSKTLF